MLRIMIAAAASLLAVPSAVVAKDVSIQYQAPYEASAEQRLAAVQLAIIETLRLGGQCGSADPKNCEPEVPCDAQGQRSNGYNCVLVWKREEGKPEYLTWVEGWEVHGSIYSSSFRLPTLGQDGKLY
jgi:hypothetical protein